MADTTARVVHVTPLEESALRQPLSNDARVLYLLGLRPLANSSSGAVVLDYRKLIELLDVSGETITRGRQINPFIKELSDGGLITLPQECDLATNLHGKKVTLCLICATDDPFQQLHGTWYAMSREWQPVSKVIIELAAIVGLVDCDFDQRDVGEFVAYWLGRPHVQYSAYQWHHKFVSHLKLRRTYGGRSDTISVGHQQIKAVSAISADENAKQLVEKYNKSKDTRG